MMSFAITRYWPVAVTLVGLLTVLAFNLQPYHWNPSVLFHLDQDIHNRQPAPAHFVVLEVPAYDGAHYYQIARNMHSMFTPSRWGELRSQPTLSYAYQRFLLPFAAYVLSVGQVALLPYIFLLLNVLALIMVCVTMLRAKYKPLYALALAFSPSAMVALHFSLAEPLTLLILAVFLTRFTARGEHLGWTDAILLSLLTLSREVNILFIGVLLLYVLWRRKWSDVPWLLAPILTFFAFHGLIYAMFGEIPFLTSAGKRTLPFQAIAHLLAGGQGYNRLTLTSIPLFLLFVLPALLWIGKLFVSGRDRSFLAVGSLAFLLLMTTMPDYIWGSITSIGRVITPVYPLVIILAARHNSFHARFIAGAVCVVGVGAAAALASSIHPYFLT